MIWAKIKKAINSTLGTKNFKPLDKIIEDGFVEVKEKQNAIGETANSTLEALQSGENDFSVNFAEKVTSLSSTKIDYYDKTATSYKYDLYQAGAGLYLIIERYNSSQKIYTHLLYYTGIKSTSVTYYSTVSENNNGVTVNNGILSVSAYDTKYDVYKINIS